MVDFFQKEPEEAKPPVDVTSIQLDCSNCGKHLAKVMLVKDAPTSVKIKANCCFCGDSSFLKEVSGAFYMVPSEGVKLEEAPIMGDNNSFVIKTTKELPNV